MTRNSLRLRLVAGGAVTIVIALAIAGVTLTLLFERHVVRTVAADLEVYLNQLLAGIDIGRRQSNYRKPAARRPTVWRSAVGALLADQRWPRSGSALAVIVGHGAFAAGHRRGVNANAFL